MIESTETQRRLDLHPEAAKGSDAPMMRGMYAAISGLEAHQTMLDVTANNLANVDTVGYKAQRTEFVDELSQLVTGASGPNGNNAGKNPTQVGLGVQVGSIDNILSQGSMETTGNATDVAISGDGYFRVADGSPPTGAPFTATFNNVQYTRAGDLTTNSLGFLTTQTGMYVIGKNAVAAGTPRTSPTPRAPATPTLTCRRARPVCPSGRTEASPTSTRMRPARPMETA